ncbi:MAG: elongation factor G [Planctomycetaceae bacterium]|jgi:elongation factor G|nr:elongation factor G [Planctomycetaceae bacterium]
MTKYQTENIRNIALCGHGNSGKTTLADAMLNLTGAVKKPASVDEGTSICDFDEEEKSHKYTIEASVIHFDHAGKHFNVIDTPGYPDFIGQTIGALGGVDTAAIVINAQSGIEVNTRRVFAEAKKMGLGRIIILNKMDADNINFSKLLESVKEVFGNECVPVNVPLGHGPAFKGVVSTLKPGGETAGALIDPNEIHENLIETIVTADEEVMERYLEGNMPTEDELARLLVTAVSGGGLIPILCVSGKSRTGLPELLDALTYCTLPPDVIPRQAKNAEGEEVEVKFDADGPVIAQVFKTRIDPFVQKLSFIRVYSGTLKTGMSLNASTSRRGFKIAQLFEMQAGETQPVEEAGPGGIVAVAKLEELHTCSTLGDFVMDRFPFPTPMVGLAASPKSRGDETKLSGALAKLSDEDPTFLQDRNEQTKQLVITGMSELHLQIIQERLKRRDKVEIETKEPKIPYRETIQIKGEGMYRHKKQSGGAGQFGEVHIRMYPFPGGTDPETFAANKEMFPSMKSFQHFPENNFLWVDSIVGGTIPGNFMPAIEKGFKERMVRGVIAGYQVQDVCVEVHFGKHHPVDSNEQAFKTAGSMAFKTVFMLSKPALLEPIVILEVTVPTNNVGDVSSDLSTRRGRPLGMESAGGGLQTIRAEVPLSEVMTYSRTLASMTGGQGSYSIEFDRYDVVPGNIQQQVIASAKMEDEEDE